MFRSGLLAASLPLCTACSAGLQCAPLVPLPLRRLPLSPYLYCSHCVLPSVCSGLTPQPCAFGLPVSAFCSYPLLAARPPPSRLPYRSSPSSTRRPSPRRRQPSLTDPSRLAPCRTAASRPLNLQRLCPLVHTVVLLILCLASYLARLSPAPILSSLSHAALPSLSRSVSLLPIPLISHADLVPMFHFPCIALHDMLLPRSTTCMPLS